MAQPHLNGILIMFTRDYIESGGRCRWMDIHCPNCGDIAFAYQGVKTDYAILCQNYNCKNWSRVAHINDSHDKIDNNDYEDINHR
jgi:hypothetical protein